MLQIVIVAFTSLFGSAFTDSKNEYVECEMPFVTDIDIKKKIVDITSIHLLAHDERSSSKTPLIIQIKRQVIKHFSVPRLLHWNIIIIQQKPEHLLTYSMEQSPSWEANWFCS